LLSLFLVAGCSGASANSHTFPGFNYPDGRPIALKDNPAAVNVTYQELTLFLEGVEIPKGACLAVAVGIHDSAEDQGIRAGILLLQLTAGYHAIDIFQTADRGLVCADLSYGRELVDLETVMGRYGPIGGIYEFW
jgi:hypothetical protein